MNFDTLITIAVIIYIVVSIRKAFKAGKKENTPPPASGWKRKIQDFLNEVREEIEKANREQQTTQSPVESSEEIDLADKVRLEKSDEKTEPPSFWDEVKAKDKADEKPPASVSKEVFFYETKHVRQPPRLDNVPEEPEESHRNIRKSGSKQEPSLLTKQKKPQKTLCLDKQSLRKAIIWSEILAPPVGLRD